MDKEPEVEESQSVEVEVDPHKTTLADLLEMAEGHSAGTISIKGEQDDGTIQWGVVITCGDGAGGLMENLQVVVDANLARWLTSKMN